MKNFPLALLLVLAFSMVIYSCSGSKKDASSKALGKPFNPKEYSAELDKLVEKKQIQVAEAALIRDFAQENAAKMPDGWTFQEVLRRAKGKDQMMREGIEGEIIRLEPWAVEVPEPGILDMSMTMRFTNRLGHNLSNFSVWMEFLDPAGNSYFSTNYFTYLRVFLNDSRTEEIPFSFRVVKEGPGNPGMHFKAVLEGKEPANVVFHLAHAQFENGQNLDAFWLDPNH